MLVQERNREMYVDGLQAMQAYLAMRNEQIEIPVGRVVSIADMTLHYIFSVPCADRAEYDALVYHNVGRDRRLTVITLIVLAAMLRRADGPQARACRAVLMEDRNEDFYDGVSLYERFLEREGLAVSGLAVRGESHFSQEDFETDIMNEIISLRHETMQLKNKLSHMENQQYNQFNAPVYSHCTFNTHNTTNNYYPQAPEPKPEEAEVAEERDEAYPREGKYSDVRRYIEERKRHDEEFKSYCQTHTLRDLCGRLSREFGWFVDEHSLGANLNRNR